MHGGAILTDRHHEDRVREPQPKDGTREALSARGMSPFPYSHGQYAVGQGEHVAALQILLMPPVDPIDSAESRMESVDQVGQLSFAPAGWHRQGGDRHPVPDPDTRTAR